MGVFDDMNKLMQMKAAMAMEKASEAESSGAGMGMGTGLGLMMPAMFAQYFTGRGVPKTKPRQKFFPVRNVTTKFLPTLNSALIAAISNLLSGSVLPAGRT